MKERKEEELKKNEKNLQGKELKEKKVKEKERKEWEPFCVVSSNGCVILKDDAWNYDQDVTTYVYLLGNYVSEPTKPTDMIAISKKPEISFGNDMMAVIYARTTRGYVMGDEYYVGSMVLGKSSLFVQVDPEWDPFDGFTIYIVCCPKERALEMRPESESDKKRCGPFTLMRKIRSSS